MGKLHAARLSSSPRLQRLLEVLEAHPGGISTLQIVLLTNSCAVHSDVSELRDNKIDVRHWYAGKTANGRRVSMYRLQRANAEEPTASTNRGGNE